MQYVAYSPRSMMSEEDLTKKLELFRERKGTTGWAVSTRLPIDKAEAMTRTKTLYQKTLRTTELFLVGRMVR